MVTYEPIPLSPGIRRIHNHDSDVLVGIVRFDEILEQSWGRSVGPIAVAHPLVEPSEIAGKRRHAANPQALGNILLLDPADFAFCRCSSHLFRRKAIAAREVGDSRILDEANIEFAEPAVDFGA